MWHGSPELKMFELVRLMNVTFAMKSANEIERDFVEMNIIHRPKGNVNVFKQYQAWKLGKTPAQIRQQHYSSDLIRTEKWIRYK